MQIAPRGTDNRYRCHLNYGHPADTGVLPFVQNDDIEFLSDPDGIESVSLCLVADVFGRTLVEAMADLRRLVKRLEREEVAS